MYDFELTDELRRILKRLIKKDKVRYLATTQKIEEITHSGNVDHYKNLCYDLSDSKRAHIDSHFVLTFKVDKPRKKILFVDLQYHDTIYRI